MTLEDGQALPTAQQPTDPDQKMDNLSSIHATTKEESPTSSPRKAQLPWKSGLFTSIVPFLGLFLVITVFGIATDGKFLSSKNLVVIMNQAISVMIAGTGVAFVLSIGSLDFSHGSLVALSAGLGALVMGATNNVLLCVLTIVGFASLTGLANGIILTKFKVPSFILTMSVLFMYRGLTIAVCRGGSIPIPLWMGILDSFPIKLGVLLAVLVIFNYIYTYTKFGLYCRAIGSGELAAKFAGVPTQRIKVLVFVISGLLAGVAATIMLIRNGGISTRFATFFETEILTSLVLGGMPLTGGSGAKTWSIIIGAFLIMALKNGLLLMGATDKALQLFMGVLFLIAVSISFDRRNVTVIK